ncbi:Nucleolar MIF4G domain-containing protein 1 [Trichinella britovi]|uniref:Nucleolar MIF4G domain-containing protein 1 n=1 Tax=Trichinella britovi TaxID=45882 RepID=A0A0V1CMQ9_TRIBR|nr:Nucleolar MIF4G domain-containing protein 1 [Trichinella britovi]
MNTVKHFKLTQSEKRLLRQEKMNHKDRRKAAKLKKKMRHLAYTSKMSYEEVCKEANTKKKATSERPKVLPTKTKSTALEKRSLKEEKRREKQRLLHKELLENDNREIKKYEKLLKLKKKKNNALPKSFSIDGLDCMNDMLCIKVTLKSIGIIDLLELCMGNKPYTDGSSGDFTRDTKDLIGDGEEVLSEEEEMNSEDEDGEDLEEEMEEERNSENAEFANTERENIYGDQSTSELQCALKHEMLDETFASPEEQAMAERVEKILKRFINKLSESNVLVSSREVMELFRTNPQHVVKRVFTEVILDACFTAFRLPDRLLITISVLVAILHSTLSSNFSAYFVEMLVQKLEEKRTDENEQEIESNALQNGYLLVTSHKLLMDIFNSLMQSGRCLDLQLLVPLVKNLGFVLRKACPSDLKDFVMSAIAKMEKHGSESSRAEAFTNILMIDLNAIKNNNASKICHYDPDLIDHFTKLLRSCLSGKTPEMPLAFGLMDILEASTKGRWWIVGSSYVVPVAGASKSGDLNQFNYSEDLLRLAKKNRMNTDLKRNIFCCILSAEDYLNAFEKLLKLNLSDKQEREIIHILFVCCLNEKTFNPFYGYLVQKFCSYNAKFVLTTQFALWDKLKILKTLKKTQIQNLSSLIAHLFGSLALPISVLKVINFVEIEETMTDFLKRLFTKFLNGFSTDVLRVVFGKLMKKSNEYHYLREGIRLFIVHFLLTEHEDEEKKEFKRKIRFFIFTLKMAINVATTVAEPCNECKWIDLIIMASRAKMGKGKKRAHRATSNVFAMFTQSQIQEFKEAFNMIDQNRNGFIDKADLLDMYASLGKEVGDEFIDEMINEAPGAINFTMFLTMFGEKMTGTDPEDVIRNAFQCFDEEGTGSISEHDLRTLLTTMGDRYTDDQVEELFKDAPIKDGMFNYVEFARMLKHGSEEKDESTITSFDGVAFEQIFSMIRHHMSQKESSDSRWFKSSKRNEGLEDGEFMPRR